VTPEQVQQIQVNVDSLHRLHPARAIPSTTAPTTTVGTTFRAEIAEAFTGAPRSGQAEAVADLVWPLVRSWGCSDRSTSPIIRR